MMLSPILLSCQAGDYECHFIILGTHCGPFDLLFCLSSLELSRHAPLDTLHYFVCFAFWMRPAGFLGHLC